MPFRFLSDAKKKHSFSISLPQIIVSLNLHPDTYQTKNPHNSQEMNSMEEFLSCSGDNRQERHKGGRASLRPRGRLQTPTFKLENCFCLSTSSSSGIKKEEKKRVRKIPDRLRNQPTNLIIDGVRW